MTPHRAVLMVMTLVAACGVGGRRGGDETRRDQRNGEKAMHGILLCHCVRGDTLCARERFAAADYVSSTVPRRTLRTFRRITRWEILLVEESPTPAPLRRGFFLRGGEMALPYVLTPLQFQLSQ